MTSTEPFSIRRATRRDVPRILDIIAAGAIPAKAAATTINPAALAGADAAFTEIDASPNHALFVAGDHPSVGSSAERVLGVAHLVTYRRLHHLGQRVGELDIVFVAPEARGRGVGAALVVRAIEEARTRGCHRLQLTSNSLRTDAHRFYRRLGFVGSHTGFKLDLG